MGHRAYNFACSQCGKRFETSGRRQNNKHRYCSMTCRNVAYAGPHHPSIGKPRDMTPARRGLAEHRRKNGGTEEERAVERWLVQRGSIYEREVKIGPHWVDFYLADDNLVVEADGAYWHRDQAVDIERDRQLLTHGPDGMRIIHVHFYHDRFSPTPMDEHPMEAVFYVCCNPGPDTFVDPEMFEPIPIVSLRPWRYSGFTGALYDLTVEGVHSFVAAGIVISNSIVHEDLMARHKPGQQAKYLEQPTLEAAQGMEGRLADELRPRLEGR